MRTKRMNFRGLPLLLSLCLSLSLLLPAFCLDVHAAPVLENYGFEIGLDGWTTYETVTVGTGGDYVTGDGIEYGYTWTVMPYETQMAVLEPSGEGEVTDIFPDIADTLGLSAFSRQYLSTEFIDEDSQEIDTTNFAYIYTDIAFTAGQSFTMSWNYIAFDYDPYNDASFCSFVNLDDLNDLGMVNGYVAQVGILGATVYGTGSYSTGDYGSTGWQTATFQAGETGLYRLAFVVFNLGDDMLSPLLFVDKEPGTTFQDGEVFDPIPPDEEAPPPPVVTVPAVLTDYAEMITTTSANIVSAVTGDGYAEVTERGAVIGTSSMPTVEEDVELVSGAGTGEFETLFEDLLPGTIYYVRAYAINSEGIAYGDQISFSTLPIAPVAGEATALTGNAFQANWNSVAGATGFRLDVSTDEDFEGFVDGFEDLDVGDVLTSAVTGLEEGVTYYYRVRAYNASGTSEDSNVVTVMPRQEQTITFDALPEMTYGDSGLTLEATASSGLPVSYESSDPTVANVVDGVLQVVKTGTAVIIASQAGNDTWRPAPVITQAVVVVTQVVAEANEDPDGETAETIEENVTLPDPGQQEANQIRIELIIEKRQEDTPAAFLVTAQGSLSAQDRELLQAFDIRLLLTIVRPDGSEESSPIANDQITGNILVRLHVPQEYENRQGLQVVYVDETGAITPFTTTLVIIGGVKYLQFETNHFSTYAIIGDELPAIVDTGEQGDWTTTGVAILLMAAGAAFMAAREMRRRMTTMFY